MHSQQHRMDKASAESGWLGIIGGGQLGMLLCTAARELGVRSIVLTPDPQAPAMHLADEVITAELDDVTALEDLIRRCDAITFEIEAIPDACLDRLRDAAGQGLMRVHPDPDTLARLRDKGLQKSWLRKMQLPTLDFRLTDADTTASSLLAGPIRPPLVQKVRRGGYDGKGVQILRTGEDLAALWPVAGLVEPALEGMREIAVLVVSDGAGELRAYPPVDMEFDTHWNAVNEVRLPAALDGATAQRCDRVARDAVGALGAAGVFAVELFVTEEEAIYINEISPRVHNSGHLTLEAFEVGQFAQHARAVLGLPLAPVVPRAPAAVMLNLLWDDAMPASIGSGPCTVDLDEHGLARLYWYGKTVARRGRKMGHITGLGESIGAARERALDGLARFRRGELHATAPMQGALAS